jgi:hypothetical protein
MPGLAVAASPGIFSLLEPAREARQDGRLLGRQRLAGLRATSFA